MLLLALCSGHRVVIEFPGRFSSSSAATLFMIILDAVKTGDKIKVHEDGTIDVG
jgi:hypothetical protein